MAFYSNDSMFHDNLMEIMVINCYKIDLPSKMVIQVAAIIFLFLMRLLFPTSNSIWGMVRQSYGQNAKICKKSLIIVNAKRNWIQNFCYGRETSMSYLMF